MQNALPRLVRDQAHFAACHARWVQQRNRSQEKEGYRDEWYAEQCGGCAFYLPLQGVFANDYGACSHADSPQDGRVVFEHDGCEVFTPAREGWGS